MLEVVSDAGPHVCPACGEVKIRTTDKTAAPDSERWDVKTYSRHGKAWWRSMCVMCHRAQARERAARANPREPDPLGNDPLLPVAPFREWLERVVDRYDRLYGNDPTRSLNAAQSGAREVIAEKLAAELGGPTDRWARAVYRGLFESKSIRLTLADRMLVTLDFDGTTLDDLWPISDEECAA